MIAVRVPQTAALWCAAIVGACVGLSVALHPGIPAYRHDWQWPVDPGSFGSWFYSKLDAWNWQGLGAPNIAIQVHPFFMINALAAHVMSSKLMLVGWLTASGAISAAGAALLAMAKFSVRPWPAIVTGMLYALSPLVVNKVVAGHIPYLLGCSAIPWLVIAATSRQRAAPWACALCLAWTGIQLQLLVYGIMLTSITSVKEWGVRNLLPVALAAGSIGPYAWALLRPAATQVTIPMHTSLPWELAQSVPLAQALRGIGYFAGYWESAVASFFGSAYVPWIYLAGIVLALIIRRDANVLRLSIIYLLGVLLISGLKGPLASPLSWLFGHVGAASAFRELYDAAIFVTLAGAVGAGIALSAIPIEKIQGAAALVIGILLVAPWLTGGVLRQTGSAYATSLEELPTSESAHEQRPSRFYLAPGANPVAPADQSIGGADPAAFSVNHMAPFWAYTVHGHEGAVIWAIQRGGNETNAVAQSLGIAALVAQPDLTTKFGTMLTSGKSLHIQEFSGTLPTPRGWSSSSKVSKPILGPSDRGPSIVRLVPKELESSSAAPLQEDVLIGATHGLPLHSSWVPAQDWWFLSEQVAQAAPHGAITSGSKAPLLIRCASGRSTINLYAAGDGRVKTTIIRSGNWQKLSIVCGDSVRVVPAKNSYIVLTSGSDLAAWSSIVTLGSLRGEPIDVQQSGDTLTVKALKACERCTIVLSERASPGWFLSIDEQKIPATRLPSGFSGWRIDLLKGQIIRLTYAPSYGAAIFELCAAICWLGLVCGTLITLFLRPTINLIRAS